MRSFARNNFGVLAATAAIALAGCKSSTAASDTSTSSSGSMSAGMDGGTAAPSADGGMMGSMSNAAHDMGTAANNAGADMKAGASAAGQDVRGAASSAGAAMADAGTQAMGEARDAAGNAASTASSTASQAASAAADAGSAAASTASDATKPSAGPTDPQIAAIVVAANQAELDAAKYAEKHAKSAKVKAAAKTMFKDHTSVAKKATALLTKLGVTPEETDASRQQADAGKKNMDNLKTLKGADFDKAYLDNEVTYHESLGKALDDTLIPSAQNADLKDLLTKVRPVVQAHLDHVKSLQSSTAGASK